MVGHTNNSRRWRKPWSCTAEMSWLSREIHLMSCSVIFYHIRWVVLLRLFVSPHESVVLLMFHVPAGLLLFSTWSYFHSADIWSSGLQSNVTRASEFCHKLCSDVKKMFKSGFRPRLKLPILIRGKIPRSARSPSCRSDQASLHLVFLHVQIIKTF